MLHGDPIWSVWPSVLAVAAWGVFGLAVAIRKFHWEPAESR